MTDPFVKEMKAEDSKWPAIVETGKVHTLKTWPRYFEDILSGRKPFEWRINDRSLAVGDVLILQEWEPARENLSCTEGRYTGREIRKLVSYVFHPFATNKETVVMGLSPMPSTVRGTPLTASIPAQITVALELAEEMLSQAPFSTKIWPNGMHPNTGINIIRDALSLSAEGGAWKVSDDLVQRCRELLEWGSTGLLADGKGGAVRALADRLKEKIGETYALNVAESQTRDDAMRAFVALARELEYMKTLATNAVREYPVASGLYRDTDGQAGYGSLKAIRLYLGIASENSRDAVSSPTTPHPKEK